jgi:hypothetical protein
VAADESRTEDRWSRLTRSELVALGRTNVTERLESLGCRVNVASSRTDSRLEADTPSGRLIEVFVSTQRLGGYAFWTKRRLVPETDRYAAIVLLDDSPDPDVYLVPSTEWLEAVPPLKNRDNVGKRSEPEYGISLARSSLPALERYRWEQTTSREPFT